MVPTENFEVISPQNVLGVVGLDTVLPCNVSSTKPLYDIEVQWKKITDGRIEDVYIWRDTVNKPGQKYVGRTELLKDGLATGNVSLTLKNVLPADEGTYSCIVNSKDWSADTTTMLSIAGWRFCGLDYERKRVFTEGKKLFKSTLSPADLPSYDPSCNMTSHMIQWAT